MLYRTPWLKPCPSVHLTRRETPPMSGWPRGLEEVSRRLPRPTDPTVIVWRESWLYVMLARMEDAGE